MAGFRPRAQRHELQIPGRVIFEKSGGGSDAFICNTVNISASGALIETGHILPEGVQLNYSFNIPDHEDTLSITGEIIRGYSYTLSEGSAGHHNTLNRYGFKFIVMTREDRVALEGYFARNN